MKKLSLKSLIIFVWVVSLVFLGVTNNAFAEQGFADDVLYPLQALDVEKTIAPTFSIPEASHVANGIAMRNRVAGTIHLRGVPLDSKILRAWLYWTIQDMESDGAKQKSALFNGNRVTGTKVADSLDPCWLLTGIHTYRAGVKKFIPSFNPNQDYHVVLAFTKKNSTSGKNPWNPLDSQDVLLDGATLIVIYEVPDGGIVYVYDDLNGSMFDATGTFTLTHTQTFDEALFTMSGADGQRGFGFNNGPSETTTFNGNQIAGPGAAAVGGRSASDWDGMSGWPLPQLWDVQTHMVLLNGSSSVVTYQSQADCLVPVVFVIETIPPGS
jgi:hypothetical protein